MTTPHELYTNSSFNVAAIMRRAHERVRAYGAFNSYAKEFAYHLDYCWSMAKMFREVAGR